MNEKQKLIVSVLEGMGYKPEIDKDGDIQIFHELKTLIFFVGDENEKYISIALRLYSIDEDEIPLSLTICNKMTRDMKVAKVYLDDTLQHVNASVEFIYTDEESLKENIDFTIQVLSVARRAFRRNKAELEE